MTAPSTEQRAQHGCHFDTDEPGPATRQHVICRCGWRSTGTGDAATLESFDHLEGLARAAGDLRPGQPGWTLPADPGSDDWTRRPFPSA